MRVVRFDDLPEEAMGEATPVPGWTGEAVSRTRQVIIRNGDSENFRCNNVKFGKGTTMGWHTHNCDQILVIASGKGVMATDGEEREIAVGDIVHIKAGEQY